MGRAIESDRASGFVLGGGTASRRSIGAWSAQMLRSRRVNERRRERLRRCCVGSCVLAPSGNIASRIGTCRSPICLSFRKFDPVCVPKIRFCNIGDEGRRRTGCDVIGNFGGPNRKFFETGNSHAKTENSTSDQFFDPTGSMLQARSPFQALAKNRTISPPPPSRQGRLFRPVAGTL